MGTDSTVVDSARVSFAKEASNYTQEQNNKLISYLAKHKHFTPFTHPQVTLHIQCPIFVARQDFKHVVGFSRNEVSRRYVDTEPTFFDPTWRGRAANLKQGSAATITDPLHVWKLDKAYNKAIKTCIEAYNNLLSSGVAPEQARIVLPVSLMTEYYTTGSLAAWARAYKLRTDSHAQQEIQDLYVQVGQILSELYPVSWAALTQ
jgi:thymidylate synthase (FAD)